MASSSQSDSHQDQFSNNNKCEVNADKSIDSGDGLIDNNTDRTIIGSASDNIWNLGVGAVKGIGWTLSSTYNFSVGLLNRTYSLKMKDKNE